MEQRIDLLERNEKRLREEFQTHLEERLEEETLKVSAAYELKIEQESKKSKKLEEDIKTLKNECDQKAQQISDLNGKNKKLMDELNAVKSELERKNLEIKNFSKKTDEYLRKRENQQAMALEKKIMNLNKEHEKKIDLLKRHEMEKAAKYQNF
ncbi:unnamed protein product [Gongylonema pulchrum]|uniref:Uncharacterized protein n=1 Tax=Gongylonema pulchrum TaxID=637853 RepID=A0A183DA11_9BILA|nr:unnamed protein product [Gongylonema pulchrum]